VIGIVIVSHSAKLAEGVVELARNMGGTEISIQAAGGMSMDDATLASVGVQRPVLEQVVGLGATVGFEWLRSVSAKYPRSYWRGRSDARNDRSLGRNGFSRPDGWR